MNKEEFIIELGKIRIEITDEQMNTLDVFYKLMIDWNEKVNLTRITDYENVLLKHFYDSLTIVKVIDLKEIGTLCDVGSGAGFPGIVLKIIFPHLNITLIDSLNKRVNYLKDVIQKLELQDIEAIHVRSEDYKEKTFDVVTAKAVAKLDDLMKYCFPLVNKKGKFIAMKANLQNEIEESKKALNRHYGKITNVESFQLPKENSERTLIVIEHK